MNKIIRKIKLFLNGSKFIDEKSQMKYAWFNMIQLTKREKEGRLTNERRK